MYVCMCVWFVFKNAHTSEQTMIGFDAVAEHSVDGTCLGMSLTPPTCDVIEYFKIRVQQGFYTQL